MDVREKLVELLVEFVEVDAWDDGEFIEKDIDFQEIASNLIANGVTVQQWISVKDELPKYTDEYNVMVGVASEFGYFEKVTTLRFERIKGKEPRWVIPKNKIYNVISWMPLPQPPKGE